MVTRKEIVDEAMKWIGVPFLHQGRARDGVDCVGLVICVAKTLGIEESVQGVGPKTYPRAPNGWRLREHMIEVMDPIAVEDIQPADVLLMRWRNYPQHVGMVGAIHAETNTLIHSAEYLKKVTHHILDDEWRAKIVNCFRFRGIA